jgi:hypothetical protein
MLNYCPEEWRCARVERFSAPLNGWVEGEIVTVRPDDRVYEMRQKLAKQEKRRLQDVRFIPLNGAK